VYNGYNIEYWILSIIKKIIQLVLATFSNFSASLSSLVREERRIQPFQSPPLLGEKEGIIGENQQTLYIFVISKEPQRLRDLRITLI